MAENTKIQWTDHTVNFWTGCTKVSPGCKYCYMFRDQERYGKAPTDVLKVADKTIAKVLRSAAPGDKIFTCSWSDFFIEEADQWREWAWDIIRNNPQFEWQILTKRPERIKDCLPSDWGLGWDHVWLGVSVESQQQALERMPILSQVYCKVRFLSIEPIIGPIDLGEPKVNVEIQGQDVPFHCLPAFHWVIIGGESGNEVGKYKYRPAELEWFEKIVEDCKRDFVPVFVKQMGTHVAKAKGMKDRHGGDIKEFPESLQIRQFPIFNL